MDFSPEFDPAFYRAHHADLATFSDEQLIEHYRLHGKSEGRRCAAMAEHPPFLDALRDIKPTLEIGPFYRPAFRGEGVRYLDFMDTAALRARAVTVGGDPAGVPHIDYVGSLADVGEKFRLVFSSHSIEHQPDLLRHLLEVSAVLEDGGLYALLIPDCRFCFDHFLPVSNIGEVFAAHEERRTRHPLAKVIEHFALTTHNEAPRHWQGDHGEVIFDIGRVHDAIHAHKSGQYVDVHGWQFTPDSFREIVSRTESITKLRPLRVYQTPVGNVEFCAILHKH